MPSELDRALSKPVLALHGLGAIPPDPDATSIGTHGYSVRAKASADELRGDGADAHDRLTPDTQADAALRQHADELMPSPARVVITG